MTIPAVSDGLVLPLGPDFFPQEFLVGDVTAGTVKRHDLLCQARCFQATPALMSLN